MNPFSFAFQVVLGFSLGCLVLRPDTIMPSNEVKWPLEVPMIESSSAETENAVRSSVTISSGATTGIPRRRLAPWGISSVVKQYPDKKKQTKGGFE